MDKYTFDIFISEKQPKNKRKKLIRLLVSLILLSALSYVFIELKIFQNNTQYYIFVGVLATGVAYFNGYFKKPQHKLEGYLEGKITFSKSLIQVGSDIIPVEEITQLTIHNNDYVGKKIKDFGEFDNPDGSHGVDNQLILKTKDNRQLEVNFRQVSQDEFSKLKSILISYHNSGILSFDDLVYLMKLEYDIDKNELKKLINRRSK